MIKNIIVGLFTIAILYSVGKGYLDWKKPTTSELLISMKTEIDAGLPKPTQNGLRIEKASILGNELVNNFTMIEFAPGEIDSKTVKDAMYPDIWNGLCLNQIYLDIMKKGIKFGYSYSDNEGNEVLYLSFGSNECAKNT